MRNRPDKDSKISHVLRILIQRFLISSFISIILTTTGNLYSQEVVHHFEHLTIRENLENLQILNTIQDQRGFLWFGTNGGLYRYNGYEFDIFERDENDSNSISDNWILSIAEDQNGTIWIGTNNGGLNSFDPQKFIFKRYSLKYPEQNNDLFPAIQSLAVDSLGIIWLGTNTGLYSFDPESEELSHISLPGNSDESYEMQSINVIEIDSNNQIWIGTTNGLCLYNPVTGTTFRMLHDQRNPYTISSNKITDLEFDSDGYLWIGTKGAGLDKFDPETKKIRHFSTHSGLSNDFITSIYINKKDQIYVGTLNNGGINVLSNNSNEISYISHESIDHDHPRENDIYSLFEDRSGIIWIGTDTGICRLLQTKKQFFQVNSEKMTADQFDGWKIEALCEDKLGNIWLGTARDGLYYLDLSCDKISHYTHKSGDFNSISNNTIHALHIDNEDMLWVGTDQGLNKFNKIRNNFERFYFNGPGEDKSEMNRIYTILQDHTGLLWLGMDGAGLIEFDIANESFRRFMYDREDKYSLCDPRNKVYSICECNNDFLWIGTWSGLMQFDREKEIFYKQPYNFSEYNNDIILAINNDNSDNLWVAALGGGISKFNPVHGIIEKYTKINGLPTNTIYSIEKDKKNNIWMSSNKGIIKLHIPTSDIIIFKKDDGLQSDSYNMGAFYNNRKGMLYFGSNNGFNVFSPESLQINPVIPPVVITDVFLQNKSVPPNIVYAATIQAGQETKQLNIDSDQSQLLTIKFAALDYTCPEKNHYMYKLDGYNERWVGPTTSRVVSFRDLDYGEYTFRVKGSNNSGIWNDSDISLKIEVLTPIWLTGGAFTGYFIILLLLIFGLVRAIFNRMKLKQQMNYEHLELARQKEHDHLKSTFYTNISHDLRTPLTLIIGPIEKWLRNIKNEDLRNDLKMIQKNSNRMLSLINQLFDLSRIDSGEMELKIQPVNIVEILKDMVISFSSMAEQKEINLSFSASQDSIFLNIDRDKFGNIITNLLYNAFKHTSANGKIAISVFIKRPDDNDDLSNQIVDIIVRDTGEGIPREHIDNIFDRFYQVKDVHSNSNEGTGLGLSLVRGLTELHHGTVKVKSQVNRGSTFTLSFPLGKTPDTIEVMENIISPELQTDISYQPDTEHNIPAILKITDQVQESESAKLKDAPQLLIVEDNAEIRAYLRKCLDQLYKISEAKNGKEGWEIAGRIDPDLIISDIMMPEMDGYELCRKIKTNELTSHIPVILLTARATIEDKIGGLEMGADDYIFKPFDSLELTTRVKNLIVQRKKLWERFHEEIIVQPGKITVTSVDNVFLQKVISVVEEYIADSHLETQFLADRVGMSRMNLHRKIKALTGQTPGQFISTMRLKRAAQLIKDQAGNVTEVAYDVGFNSLSYFARCFKSEFGVLPSEFAKNQEFHG